MHIHSAVVIIIFGVFDSSAGVSRKSEGWVGLGCCELAISAECRRECRQVRPLPVSRLPDFSVLSLNYFLFLVGVV